MRTIKQSIITIILCMTAVVGVSLVYSWTGPTQTPPNGNVPAPINVGASTQYKAGALGIGGLLQVRSFQMTAGAGAGKVLTSDAVGLASWTAASSLGLGGGGGGTSYWALSGTNIYNTNTGNIGIGTTNPEQRLDVQGGNIRTSGGFATNNRDPNLGSIYPGSQGINTYDVFAQWTVRANQLCLGGGMTGNGFGDCRTAWPSGGGLTGGGNTNYVAKWTGATSLQNSIIYDNGNVGIGTVSPTQKLDVGSGNVSANDYWIGKSGKWASQLGIGNFNFNNTYHSIVNSQRTDSLGSHMVCLLNGTGWHDGGSKTNGSCNVYLSGSNWQLDIKSWTGSLTECWVLCLN